MDANSKYVEKVKRQTQEYIIEARSATKKTLDEIKGSKKPDNIKGKQEDQRHIPETAVIDRRLEDVRFWTEIMKEHALFVKVALPCDRTRLIAKAQALFERFQDLEDRLRKVKKLDPELLEEIIRAVISIIEFQRRVLRMMLECELRANEYPLLLDHITREAVHFLELLKEPQSVCPLVDLLRLEVFWLRIMKEHVEVIIHLLDPSERTLIAQAQQFKNTFSMLLETARDFDSMVQSDPRSFNAAIRFTNEVVENTVALRNFKATAYELAILCQVLDAIPVPLLLDHVRREADKFLGEIEELRALIQGPSCNNEE